MGKCSHWGWRMLNRWSPPGALFITSGNQIPRSKSPLTRTPSGGGWGGRHLSRWFPLQLAQDFDDERGVEFKLWAGRASKFPSCPCLPRCMEHCRGSKTYLEKNQDTKRKSLATTRVRSCAITSGQTRRPSLSQGQASLDPRRRWPATPPTDSVAFSDTLLGHRKG